MAKPSSIIGASVGRVEGAEKVSGRRFTAPTFISPIPCGERFFAVRIRMRASRASTLSKRESPRRKSDRHRQRRAGSLSGEEHSRYSGFLLGQGAFHRRSSCRCGG